VALQPRSEDLTSSRGASFVAVVVVVVVTIAVARAAVVATRILCHVCLHPLPFLRGSSLVYSQGRSRLGPRHTPRKHQRHSLSLDVAAIVLVDVALLILAVIPIRKAAAPSSPRRRVVIPRSREIPPRGSASGGEIPRGSSITAATAGNGGGGGRR